MGKHPHSVPRNQRSFTTRSEAIRSRTRSVHRFESASYRNAHDQDRRSHHTTGRHTTVDRQPYHTASRKASDDRRSRRNESRASTGARRSDEYESRHDPPRKPAKSADGIVWYDDRFFTNFVRDFELARNLLQDL